MLRGEHRISTGSKRQRFGAGHRPVFGGRVDEPQRVAPGRVVVVVADAEPLHQAMHEGVVGLAVLHALLELRIVGGHAAVVIVRQAEVVEHGAEDLLRRLFEKDPMVAAEEEKVEVRHDGEGVDHQFAFAEAARDLTNEPVEVSFSAAGPGQRDREALAQHLLDVHIAARGDQLEVEPIGPRDRVGEPQSAQHERVPADLRHPDALDHVGPTGKWIAHGEALTGGEDSRAARSGHGPRPAGRGTLRRRSERHAPKNTFCWLACSWRPTGTLELAVLLWPTITPR